MTAGDRLRDAARRFAARCRRATRGDGGHISVFTVLSAIALLLVAGLVLDAGLALSSKSRALDVAQAAARAGAQQVDASVYRNSGVLYLDRARARSAAQNWLAAAGMTGEVTVAGTTVTVTARTSRRTQLLTLVGVRHLDVSATATATAYRGVSAPNR